MASRRRLSAKADGGPASPLPPNASEAPNVDQIALYSLDKACAALGVGESDLFEFPQDTEHQARLGAIINKGEAGRWRSLLPPPPQAITEVERLLARAPHFDEFGALLKLHLRSSGVIGLPTLFPPVLLVGEHGLGKSWLLSRLGAVLGLPYRRYVMSSSSLSEGISGSHPSWRNAAPGLVARTLLTERVANPILFVDEIDKGAQHFHNGDPCRPFYALLDPCDAREFVDEFLGFPIDASHVLWVMAANDTVSIPTPILDRLRIIRVPAPCEAQRAHIAASIYTDANAACRGYFEAQPKPIIAERLVGMSPRKMRQVLDEAMVKASAEGRRQLRSDDFVMPRDATKTRIGFLAADLSGA